MPGLKKYFETSWKYLRVHARWLLFTLNILSLIATNIPTILYVFYCWHKKYSVDLSSYLPGLTNGWYEQIPWETLTLSRDTCKIVTVYIKYLNSHILNENSDYCVIVMLYCWHMRCRMDLFFYLLRLTKFWVKKCLERFWKYLRVHAR